MSRLFFLSPATRLIVKAVKVVLVHGIFDKGKSMRWLAAALEAAGHECFCPDLVPSSGANGLEDLAGRLASAIDERLGKGGPIVLLGFSMGAIVSRIYLQELEGYRRVKEFYSISGPHAGSWTARFGRGKGARELRSGSSLLKRLDEDLEQISGVRIICYRTPFDLMVFPSKSASWSRADENVTLPVLAHPLMLRSRKLASDLIGRIAP